MPPIPAPNLPGSSPQRPLPETVSDRFTPEQLAERLLELRRRYQNGALDAAQFNAALAVFQFNDEVGHLWAPGANTGQWYRWDRSEWTPDQPPQALTMTHAQLETSAAWLTTSDAPATAGTVATSSDQAGSSSVPSAAKLQCKVCNLAYASGAFCSACGGKLEPIAPQLAVSNACSGCGKPLDAGAKFCKSCGLPAAPAGVCPKCGAPSTGTKFCTRCGGKLT